MKTNTITKSSLSIAFWGLVLCFLWAQNTTAQTVEKRIFFPYFRWADLPTLAMPLEPQKTQVMVHIDGIRAEVSVTQTYKNTTQNSLKLTCVVPTDLDALSGVMAGKEIVRKPSLPKEAYKEAKQPLFMPDVPAGEIIELTWAYAVICEKQEEISTFRFPAFQPSLDGANIHYDLKVQFHTDYPIRDITSQEHLIEVHYPTSNTAEVIFTKEEQQAGSRPFVLSYHFYNGKIEVAKNPSKNEEGVMRGDSPNDEKYTIDREGRTDDQVNAEIYNIPKVYEVREHDYVEKIAQKFGVSVTNILKWNHLKENAHLHKGQKLKLEVPCMKVLHTVEEDEYPYQIAQLYGVDVAELLEWNKLKDSDKLKIGQKIMVYQVRK
jgi:LysM repeat protein